MSKVSLCPYENVNQIGISKPSDGIGEGLYVKDNMPINFPAFHLDEKVNMP